MTTVLEVIAGVLLAGGFAVLLTVLGAGELGRLTSRDDQQRDVAQVEPVCRRAA